MPCYACYRRRHALALALGVLSGLQASAAQAQGAASEAAAVTAPNPAEALELPTVEVIGTTLLPGLGTPARDVPANVQVHTQQDLARQRQLNITDYLEQNASGITINAAQGNPFQPDVSFRGFTASPCWACRRACRYSRMACASTSRSAMSSTGT